MMNLLRAIRPSRDEQLSEIEKFIAGRGRSESFGDIVARFNRIKNGR